MAAKKTVTVMIVNRRSKKALQTTGQDNGLVVAQAAPTGSDAQLWRIVEGKDGVKLVNKANGKVLDVMAEGTENGTWAQTWDDVKGESQRWQIVTVTATYKKLVNVRSGKVLDIVDMSDEEGAPAQIWEDVDGAGQQWKLVDPKEVAAKAKKPAKKAAKKAPAKKPAAKKAAPAKKAAAPAEKPATPVVKAATVTKEVKKAPAKKAAPAAKKPAAKKAAPAAKAAPAVKPAEKKDSDKK